MTLHVIEVKVVDLTVLQTAEIAHIVQLNLNFGYGMCATQIHYKLSVNEQVHVIIACESEIQIVVFIVDELCMAFKGHVIVGIIVVLG